MVSLLTCPARAANQRLIAAHGGAAKLAASLAAAAGSGQPTGRTANRSCVQTSTCRYGAGMLSVQSSQNKTRECPRFCNPRLPSHLFPQPGRQLQCSPPAAADQGQHEPPRFRPSKFGDCAAAGQVQSDELHSWCWQLFHSGCSQCGAGGVDNKQGRALNPSMAQHGPTTCVAAPSHPSHYPASYFGPTCLPTSVYTWEPSNQALDGPSCGSSAWSSCTPACSHLRESHERSGSRRQRRQQAARPSAAEWRWRGSSGGSPKRSSSVAGEPTVCWFV